jgi:hypothetical protein
MSFEVEVTSGFKKQAKRIVKKFPSLKKELAALIEQLEAYPTQGVSIGKGCYKVRIAIASKGKGKSGGARVITHVHIVKFKVYLLSIYDKSEMETISDRELMDLLKQLR